MSELADCINNLSAKDILRAATKKGPPFYINVLGLSSYCDAFQAILDAYVLTIPDATQLAAQNTMVCTLADAGLWDTQWDIFYVFANGDSPNCLLNWVNPGTYDATVVNNGGALTFTAWEGITGDGLAYMNTGWIPNTATYFLKDASSFGAYIRTDKAAAAEAEMGCNQASWTAGIYLSTRFTGDLVRTRHNLATIETGPNTHSDGFFISDRTTNVLANTYRNKSVIDIDVNPTTARGNRELYLLCYNNNGSAEQQSLKQISCAFAGGVLTEPGQVNIVSDAVNDYMTFLGKNVY